MTKDTLIGRTIYYFDGSQIVEGTITNSTTSPRNGCTLEMTRHTPDGSKTSRLLRSEHLGQHLDQSGRMFSLNLKDVMDSAKFQLKVLRSRSKSIRESIKHYKGV